MGDTTPQRTDEAPEAPVPDVAAIEKRIQVLTESTRRERDRAAARTDGIQTRATVLIGAAGIVGGIQGGRIDLSAPWAVASVVLFALTALTGLVLLWPLRVLVVSNQTYFDEMMDYHPVDLQEALLRNELNAVHHTQRRLTFRSWTLIIGFALLAAAWGASLMAMIETSLNPPADPPIQVEIVNGTE